jgi:hypothetical protein
MGLDERANCVAFDVAVLDDQIVSRDEKAVQPIQHAWNVVMSVFHHEPRMRRGLQKIARKQAVRI